MISMASLDPFMSVTCAQGEPALIREEHRVPVADLPILAFCSKCQMSFTVPGSEHRAHQGMLALSFHPLFGQRHLHLWPAGGRFVGLWLCSQKGADIPVLLMGWGLSTALSSSTVTAYLLQSPPSSWNCAGRHSKPSGNGTYCWTACATFVGSRYRVMLTVVTLTLPKCKTSGKQLEILRSETMSVTSTCKTIPSLGVASLLHL